MTQEQTIPVVNMEDWEAGGERREAFVQEVGDALKKWGFVALEGHGIPQELFDKNYDNFREFFDLDEETKQRYEFPEKGRRRGYTSFGVEHAKDSKKPDLKEFFHLGRDLPEDHPMTGRIVANAWPEEVEGLRDDALTLFDNLEDCSLKLLEAVGRYLEIDPDYLPQMAQDGDTIIRVIHYPVCDGFDEPGVMRAAQHEDINLMTLLPPADQSGLELLTRDGEWMPIHAIPGQIIADTGDMMQRITNGKIPATTHRVVNPSGEPTPRYSMPFFVHPHPDAMLEVLDVCLEEGEEPKEAPITADEFLSERLREIGLGK